MIDIEIYEYGRLLYMCMKIRVKKDSLFFIVFDRVYHPES